MVENFSRYDLSSLVFEEMYHDDKHEKGYPVGRIDDALIRFEHYSNWEEASGIWLKRCARINYDNLFFEMTCTSESEIERFLLLPYDKKIAFTDIPIKAERIINVEPNEMEYVNRQIYSGNLAWYMCDKVNGTAPWTRNYDLIKLLLGEDEYMR